MKIRTLAVASTFALLATSANAAITMQAAVEDDLNGTSVQWGLSGHVMLEDFDNPSDPNVLYTGNVVTTTPDPITNSAPPPWSGGVPVGGSGGAPVDPTDYASVQKNTSSTFSTLNGYYLTSFSFYLGSPDDYNRVVFNLVGGGQEVFQGPQIWGGPSFNGDRTKGFRVFYDFGGAKVSSITFSTGTQDAFEFDGLAGTLAVPEPATWAMMIMGFGAAGAMIRSRLRMAIA